MNVKLVIRPEFSDSGASFYTYKHVNFHITDTQELKNIDKGI